MSELTLTRGQQRKLRLLEKDLKAKIVGIEGDCPVVLHTGIVTNHQRNLHLSIISKSGRLQGMGKTQSRKFQERKPL